MSPTEHETTLNIREQMENHPQWQDKPDKEGWWWAYYFEKDKLTYRSVTNVKCVRGVLCVLLRHDFSTIEEFINRGTRYKNTLKFSYISPPEPYKGEE